MPEKEKAMFPIDETEFVTIVGLEPHFSKDCPMHIVIYDIYTAISSLISSSLVISNVVLSLNLAISASSLFISS